MAGTESATTDSEGWAQLILNGGETTLLISKAYFKDYTEVLTVSENVSLGVELERLFADAKFRVVNPDGSRERDAEVEIGDSVILTNSLGLATFKALKVDTSYLYTVRKEGFESSSGELILEKDSTIDVGLLVVLLNASVPAMMLELYPQPADEHLHIRWSQQS